MDSSINFRTYDSANCSTETGCSIVFNVNSEFQYVPSNSNNYLVVLQGSVPILYHDGTLINTENPYSNKWSNYIDTWDYFKSVHIVVSSGMNVMWARMQNLTSSQCTFQAAKIVNEQIEKVTNNKTHVFIFGSDCTYNGTVLSSPSKTSTFFYPAGNSVTHTILAGSSPVTAIIIEEI